MRLKVRKSSSVTGKSLQQLDKLFKKSIIIGCIIRENSVIIPSGDTIIEENDVVMVLSRKENINLVNRLFKPEED